MLGSRRFCVEIRNNVGPMRPLSRKIVTNRRRSEPGRPVLHQMSPALRRCFAAQMAIRATGKRKRPYYTRVPWLMEQPFRPEEPPTWFLRLGHTADEWRRVAEGQQKRLDAEWWQGVLAVYDHFGIEFSAPGAHKDLALSLAFRHERNNARSYFRASAFATERCASVTAWIRMNHWQR